MSRLQKGNTIMNKTYLVMAIIVSTTMTLGFAYAERSTVEVPFDFHGTQCTFDSENVKYTCVWEGSSETVTKEIRIEAGVVPEEQLAEERKEAHEIAEALEDKPTPKTEQEKLIERLADKIDNDDASPADMELYKLLKEVKEKCYFGIEEGRLIQNFESFEIPDADIAYWGNFNYGTNVHLGKLYKLMEACDGWADYKVTVLGERYLDLVKDDSTTQSFHGDMATTEAVYPSQKLTDESFKGALEQAETWICSSSFYDYEFKKSHNCFETPEIVAGGIDPCNGNKVCQAYHGYLRDGYYDLSKMKKQEAVRALQSTADSFAQGQNVDPADLKNWLAEQRELKGGQK